MSSHPPVSPKLSRDRAPGGGDGGRCTIVVKVGTSSILRGDSGTLALSTLACLVETLATLRARGHDVVLVSSGAVGVGCQRLGLAERPKRLAELQAMAAIGQPHLMRYYDEFFSALRQPIAQVLLSADALDSRSGYRNAQATLDELLRRGVIPVVNENDSVAISELRFGDNDTLSALVAVLVGASHLFLATDVDALYTANPHVAPPPGQPPAEPIREVADVCEALARAEEAAAGGGGSGSAWGTGGIATKLRAARLAAAAGVTTVIHSAQEPGAVAAVLGGACDVGTRILPQPSSVASHKRWLLALPPASGTLTLDAGACKALARGNSLFFAGVSAVTHPFCERDAVRVLDSAGRELARAVVNYGSEACAALAGRQSREIFDELKYHGPDELAHRRNIVLLTAAAGEAVNG
mmetsp:Transcript_3601/g.11664  ORF Transcript_3601/g.11664 Transcript_3601/m.11664 type:complete len:411 (-) Transcript_3601:736-1968(-)